MIKMVNLKNLDVTINMSTNINVILTMLSTIKMKKKPNGSMTIKLTKEEKCLLSNVESKVKEIEDYYWRPVDSREIYALLREIFKACNDMSKAKEYNSKLSLIEANELEFSGRVQNFYGNNTKALGYYEKALALVPSHELAKTGKDKVLKSIERAKNEFPMVEKAVKNKSEDSKLWYRKGVIFLILDKVEDAVQCFNRAIQIDPTYTEAWVKKGTSLESLGKFEEAQPYFEKVLELKPNSVSAKRGLNYARYFLEKEQKDIYQSL